MYFYEDSKEFFLYEKRIIKGHKYGRMGSNVTNNEFIKTHENIPKNSRTCLNINEFDFFHFPYLDAYINIKLKLVVFISISSKTIINKYIIIK